MVLALIISIANHKKRVQAWKRLADEFGLTFDGESISGSIRDVALSVHTRTRGAGKHRTTFTIITADLDVNVVPPGLTICCEGLMIKAGKLLGGGDIELDIPELDSRMFIRGRNKAAVRKWAQRPDVLRGLSDIVDLAPTFNIESHRVTLEYKGEIRDYEKLRHTIETLVDAARALSGRGYGALVYDGVW